MLLYALLLAVVTSCCLGARVAHEYASRPGRLVRQTAGGSSKPQHPDQDDVKVAKRQTAQDCECIEYYLCVDGSIDPSGGFALDHRLGEGECPPLQVCCKPPQAQTTMPQQQVKDKGCGLQRDDVNTVDRLFSRIHDVDDREAYYGEFPWMLAIMADGEYVCGASLIHPQVALTAAHCIDSKKEAMNVMVRAGEWDPMSNDEPDPHQEVAVTRVVRHPRFYSHGLYHDVALLELASPLVESRSVGLVCVASSPDEYNNTNCLASGWGTDEQGTIPEAFKTTLRRVGLPIVEHNECQSKLRLTRLSKYFMLHDSFLCSGGVAGKDTCKGDGGGPLVCPLKDSEEPRYVQVGVISWGVGCGEQDVPAVYADVAKHAEWIEEQLQTMGYQLKSFQPDPLSAARPSKTSDNS